MDARTGSIPWGAGCRTNYIYCGRSYIANSIACTVVRFRSLVRRLIKIAGHSNKLLSQRGRASSLAAATYIVPKDDALHKTRGAVVLR